MATRTPKPKRRRERGDDGISWDRANKCYVGTVSLGYESSGKRLRRMAPLPTTGNEKDPKVFCNQRIFLDHQRNHQGLSREA